MAALFSLSRHARRWTRSAALVACLACVAPCTFAQAAGSSGVTQPSSVGGWLDMSTWLNWWPWRDTRPPPPSGVESPHYGDSLFYFFQGRYFRLTDVHGKVVRAILA